MIEKFVKLGDVLKVIDQYHINAAKKETYSTEEVIRIEENHIVCNGIIHTLNKM